MLEDGWIAHNGGDCPCDLDEPVEIQTRAGEVTQWLQASAVVWSWDAFIWEIQESLPRDAQVVKWRPTAMLNHVIGETK